MAFEKDRSTGGHRRNRPDKKMDSSRARPGTRMRRDEFGRAQVSKPVGSDDIARKKDISNAQNSQQATQTITQIIQSGDGSGVLGVSSALGEGGTRVNGSVGITHDGDIKISLDPNYDADFNSYSVGGEPVISSARHLDVIDGHFSGRVRVGTDGASIGDMMLGRDGISRGLTWFDGGGTSVRMYRDDDVLHIARGMTTAISLDNERQTKFHHHVFHEGNIGSENFVSQLTDWRITKVGAADFRYVYADEMRIKALVADITQALFGSDILTKSGGELAEPFTVPNVGDTADLTIFDLEGFTGFRNFVNGDYVRIRPVDLGDPSSPDSGAVIGNAWGTVVFKGFLDDDGDLITPADGDSAPNGKQVWEFTTVNTGFAQSEGMTVQAGSWVLDYGVSGDGFIERTVLDNQGSPYDRIVLWFDDPWDATKYQVKTQIGSLAGLGSLTGFGAYFTDRVYIQIGGDGNNPFVLGRAAGGENLHGIHINEHNYWYGTGAKRFGDANHYVAYDGAGSMEMKLAVFDLDAVTEEAGGIQVSSSDQLISMISIYDDGVEPISFESLRINASASIPSSGPQVYDESLADLNVTAPAFWPDSGIRDDEREAYDEYDDELLMIVTFDVVSNSHTENYHVWIEGEFDDDLWFAIDVGHGGANEEKEFEIAVPVIGFTKVRYRLEVESKSSGSSSVTISNLTAKQYMPKMVLNQKGLFLRVSPNITNTFASPASGSITTIGGRSEVAWDDIVANPISSGDIDNWNTAYARGDHSEAGYAKLTEANTFTANNTFTGTVTVSGALRGDTVRTDTGKFFSPSLTGYEFRTATGSGYRTISIADATTGQHAVNRTSGDARYGQLGAANTFTALNTFNAGVEANTITVTGNAYVQGGLFAKEFVADQTRVMHNYMMSPGGGKISKVTAFSTLDEVEFEDENGEALMPVAMNDIIRIQSRTKFTSGVVVKSIWRRVSSIVGNLATFATSGIDWDKTDDVGEVEVGDYAVVHGNTSDSTRDHYINFDVSGVEIPAIRIFNGVDAIGGGSEVARYGGLEGYSTGLSGKVGIAGKVNDELAFLLTNDQAQIAGFGFTIDRLQKLVPVVGEDDTMVQLGDLSFTGIDAGFGVRSDGGNGDMIAMGTRDGSVQISVFRDGDNEISLGYDERGVIDFGIRIRTDGVDVFSVDSTEARMGDLNVDGELRVSDLILMEAGGLLTNDNGDYSITEDGLDFTPTGSTSVQTSITWGSMDLSIGAITSGSGSLVYNAGSHFFRHLGSLRMSITQPQVEIATNLVLSNLPTSAPLASNSVWRDGGDLKIT